MTGNEALIALLDAFSREGVPHMVVGGYSSNFWGLPRSTKDADLVVEASKLDWETILSLLPPEMTLDDQITFETITGSKRDIVRIDGLVFFIEIFHLSDDPFNQERFRRRLEVELFPGLQIPIPTAEDVIIQKLRWYHLNRTREKDFKDACDIIRRRADRLDYDQLEKWCREHETLDLLKLAGETAGD